MPRSYTRLSEPLVRKNGELPTLPGSEALARVERWGSRTACARGPQAFGLFSCSKASNETNFMAQKFARVVMGSNNIDSCNRT